MACASNSTTRASRDSRLAPKIALVLVVKILGLIVLWSFFVRDERVTVDAHATASAFGLLDLQQDSKTKSEGNIHGQ